MIKNKYLLVLMFFIGSLIASSVDVSGRAEYFYMTRLENSQLVNIPFRLLDLNVQHQVNDKFNIFGNVGVEYRNRRDTDFMTDSNLEDFLLDIRELYMSIYLGNGEIRIGKQIHSWGSVDENSPIDNLNAYDYYYLLLGGAEKKLGAYSLAYDNYINFLGNAKFSFVYSPMHNTSRIPVNDPDYTIGLPESSSPSEENLIFKDKTPDEFSFNLTWSIPLMDVSFSSLNMYDRIFNVSGINIYANSPAGGIDPDKFSITPRYSYRKTNVLNFGTVFLFDDFTISFDYASFDSEDTNNEEDFEGLSNVDYIPMHPAFEDFLTQFDSFEQFDCCQYPFSEIAFEEKVKYSQFAFQFEMPFENNFKVNTQYFKHEIDEYSSNFLEQSCESLTNLPGFEESDCDAIEEDLGVSLEDFSAQNLFIPGVGTPYAMITSEAILFNFEKGFPDNDLIVDFNAFIDLDSYTSKLYDLGDCIVFDEDNGEPICDENSTDEDYEKNYQSTKGKGMLLSIEFEHDLGDGFELSYGLTKIFGNDDIEDYNFNSMESFSSFRSAISYYF